MRDGGLGRLPGTPSAVRSKPRGQQSRDHGAAERTGAYGWFTENFETPELKAAPLAY